MYRPNQRIKHAKIDYFMMEHRETDAEHPARFGVTAVCMERAGELLAMAIEDVAPDGTYSDFECCVWSEFRRVLSAECLI